MDPDAAVGAASHETPAGGQPSWPRVRLHVVTGKGGTGKTTVSAALALALAGDGRRVLIAEVEGRQGISQTLDVPPLDQTEQMIMRVPGGGEVWGVSVEPKAALLEYLEHFYHLGRAGKALEKLGAIDFATTIAPGVRDVLTIGKVYDTARRPEPHQGRRSRRHREDVSDQVASFVYDAVVLDAPPTGRVVRFLNVNSEVADLARVGPIRHQADSVTALLRSPACVVHVVTLLEEMPVQEAADTVAELRETGLGVGAVIVNQVRDARLSPQDLRAAMDGSLDQQSLSGDLAQLGLPHDPDTVAGLVAQASAHGDRIALEDEQLAVVDALGAPVYLLPSLPQGADADSVRLLAHRLTEQALW